LGDIGRALTNVRFRMLFGHRRIATIIALGKVVADLASRF
jgi:hypothetical protein